MCVHSRESEGPESRERTGAQTCFSLPLESGPFALSPGVKIPSWGWHGECNLTRPERCAEWAGPANGAPPRVPSTCVLRSLGASSPAPLDIRAVPEPFILVSTRYHPLSLQLKIQMGAGGGGGETDWLEFYAFPFFGLGGKGVVLRS